MYPYSRSSRRLGTKAGSDDMRQGAALAKAIFYTASTLLWIFVLLIVTSLWLSKRTPAHEARMEEYRQQRAALFEAACSEIAAHYRPKDGPAETVIPARDAFRSLDEAGRNDFAQRRHELVASCDRQGTIRKLYTPTTPEFLAALAEPMRSSASMAAFFASMKASPGLLSCVQNFAGRSSMEDLCTLPDGRQKMVQFLLEPAPDPPQEEALFFLRASVWELFAEQYNPNVEYVDGLTWPEVQRFRTNSLGWRSGEITLPKPAGVFRILCIGGSTTVEGRTNETTYPAMLQTQLRDHFHTQSIEVINCGVHGRGIGSERDGLPKYLALQPDLIVYYNFINDFRSQVGILTHVSERFSESPRNAIQAWLRKSPLLFPRFSSYLLPPEHDMRQAIRANIVEPLRQFANAFQQQGVKVAMCSFAYPDTTALSAKERDFFDFAADSFWFRQHVMSLGQYTLQVRSFNTTLKDMCAREGILYVPVAEKLRNGHDGFIDICHMNPIGIQRKAGTVAQALEPLLMH